MHFEIASKYCISDSFVDHYGYSISSEGLLPAVVDIMVLVTKLSDSFVTPWTIALQAILSMGFSRQEYWSG